MDHTASSAAAYICPMHSDIRQAGPGKCPRCGMDLLPQGIRFGLLRHMISSPLHLAVMLTAMLVLMAGAMMMMR
jgi:heavy metal-binding protein